MQDLLPETCNVRIRALNRGTGEVIHERVGHNVWTNTGREYSALIKTNRADGTPYRQDRIAYVGLGSGTQPETVSVSSVVMPEAFTGVTWLKPIVNNKTAFPNAGSRLTVRYITSFEPSDYVNGANLVYISECGLFTDGHSVTFAQGQRATMLNDAVLQAPIAYHTFSPIPKTQDISLELIWELQH
jgi:hypothetical protein